MTLGIVLPIAVALAQAPALATIASGHQTTTLRAADARVAAVAYRLATGGAKECPASYPLTGMLLHHLAEYDDKGRRIQIERYRLDRGPGVLTVLADSPADRAGLVAGDVLLSVNGAAFADPVAMAAESSPRNWRRMVQASEHQLEQALRQGPAHLKVLRHGRELDLSLGSVPGCPLRVRLAYDRQLNAFAKDGYVVLTTAILDLVRNDDEMAIVIGHELAHNLLGHKERLEAMKVPTGLLRGFGKNAARVKATEAEADRLGLRLSWAAGYDPRAAIGFWDRFYKVVPSGLPIFQTHPGLSARKRLVEEVVADLGRQGPPPGSGTQP
jgi:hypothetical protein